MEYSNLTIADASSNCSINTDAWASTSIALDSITGSGWTTVYPNDSTITWITNQHSITDPIEENKSIMDGFNFGPCSEKVHISQYGPAIQRKDNSWVAWDRNENVIVNVDLFHYPAKKMLYCVPVGLSDLNKDDIIIYNGFVSVVKKIDDDDVISIIELLTGEIKKISPTKNIFGYQYITKIVSLLGDIEATPDNPFGNLLPILMNGNIDDNLLFYMLYKEGKLNFPDIAAFKLFNKKQ